MSILIDLSLGLGYHGTVFEHLLQIVRCDPGLSTVQPTPFALEVTYQQKQQGVPSSNRMLALVNAPSEVVITGVGSTFPVPGGTAPITTYTGGAITPGGFTTPIYVWLDVTDAGGRYYRVNDKNSQTIYEPAPVILYHELAHAFHMIEGDQATTTTGEEVQATADENTFRAQVGLPLRHPSDHYGEPGEPEHGGVTFPRCKPIIKSVIDCVVATAAVGSPHAPPVAKLRRARRDYRNLSAWTALVADPVLALYGRFSPEVVRDMESDPALREAILLFVVQPVVRFLEMIETWLTADADSADPLARMDRSVDAYVAEVVKANHTGATLSAAAGAAADASRQLGTNVLAAPISPGDPWVPEELFSYLASAIAAGEGNGDTTIGYAWGFEGLALFLRRAAARLADNVTLGPEALVELGMWLSRLPIPADAELSISDAPEELRVLAERLFTQTLTREMFARRLLARWPESSAPTLESLLRDLSYVEPRT